MANSTKKVIVRTRTALHAGYLPLSSFVASMPPAPPCVDLLDLTGRILSLPLSNVVWVAFVREFNLPDTVDPERLSRRTFLARPRSEGLWVRLTLASGGALEGLAPIDATLLDGLLADRGLFLIPPDIRSNTQRLFLPRTSITDFQVVAVITTPSKNKPVPRPKPTRGAESQNLLFPPE